MKRGQVSIFIIIAVIIIVIIALVFLFKNNLINLAGSDSKIVEGIVLDCVDEVTQDSLEVIGIQGGYYDAPEKYLDLEWAFIPYYYFEGQLLMPENDVIESELASYVDNNIGFCLESFELEGFEITYTNPATTVSIEQKEVSFNVDMLVSIKKGEKTTQLNLAEHPSIRPSALGGILEVARYVTNAHNEEMICVTCLYDMLKERKIFMDVIDFTNSSSLIVFSEDQMSENPYAFEFLNKYTEEELGLELPEMKNEK